MGKVLVACEFSGVVRDAFLARGHDALSCDLLPTESPGPHVVGDVRPLLRERWDLVIAHPPCIYLCIPGAQYLKRQPERWLHLHESVDFFDDCLNANAEMVAVENPLMHPAAQQMIGRKFDFLIYAWQFGHENTKRLGIWTNGNVPPLMPTAIMQKRVSTHHARAPHHERSANRSRTFPGIAAAMADQWGKLL